jgi:hypothetical protein
LNDSHCSKNDFCDTKSNKCKAKCTYLICYGNNYCKDDYTCVSKSGGANTPAGQVIALGKSKCGADKDCKSTEYCDLAYSVCMTRCTDKSCGRNYHCQNYRSCVPNVVDLGCSYDRDCGSGYYCNAKTRKCIANCSTRTCTGTCKDYRTCVAKTSECSWDEECASGAYCTSKGQCAAIIGRLCYTTKANYCGYGYTCVGLDQYKRYNIGQCYPVAKAGGKCGYGNYPVQCPSGYACTATTASTQYGICQVPKVTSQSLKSKKKLTSAALVAPKTPVRAPVPIRKPVPAPAPAVNEDWGTGDDMF